MNEYINKNMLLRAINLNIAGEHRSRCVQLLEAILNAPVVDAVPRAELDLLKSTIAQKEEEAYNRGYADATKEIFAEIERTFNAVLVGDISDILKVLAELKKKYTEGEECPDCKHFVGCEEAVWTGHCEQYEEGKQ